MSRWLRTVFTCSLVAVAVGPLLPTPALAEVARATVEQAAINAGTEVTGVEAFDMVAVSWSGDPASVPPVSIHDAGGWHTTTSDTPGPDSGPDATSREERHDIDNRNFSEPTWVGNADGYRVDAAPGTSRIVIHLIRDETHLVPVTTTSVAGAAAAPADGPAINLRGAWGAAPPKEANGIARSLKFAVVHHTAGTNTYTPADVPAILRGIQSFHQNSRGWNDIAYNFLIDQWGGIWEGRDGGIGKPIIGSHAANFNTGTVGISLLGDFSQVQPTAAAINATSAVAGWKLALAGIDPQGTTTVVGTADNVFPTGQTVTIPTIVGHRDVGTTDCPGSVWNYLPQIRAAAASRPAYAVGVVDSMAVSPGGRLSVAGWAFDRRTPDAAGIVIDVDGRQAKAVTASIARSDVRTAYPAAPLISGFSSELDLPDGVSDVCVYAAESSYGALRKLDCRRYTVSNDPRGALESATGGSGLATFSGWAIDPNTANPIDVHVYIDGVFAASLLASGDRPDVGALNPTSGSNHGYSGTAPITPGRHTLCVYAINLPAGGNNPQLGCRVIGSNIATENPIGGLDALVARGLDGGMAGWTIDRDSTAPIAARVTVNGRTAAQVVASGDRSDLALLYPGYGSTHAFLVGFRLDPGPNRVCLVGVNVGPGSDTQIECRDVAYDPNPLGSLDSAMRSGRKNAIVTGWALDRDTTGPSDVLITVNGRLANRTSARLPRPGLDFFFPGYGTAHGFSAGFALPKGRSNVCAYALNVGAGAPLTAIGCRQLRR